jgi:hypothetical protein
VKDLIGRMLPLHDCTPRSDMARALVTICKLVEGPWQLAVLNEHASVAIRFCPFCGEDLTAGEPYLRAPDGAVAIPLRDAVVGLILELEAEARRANESDDTFKQGEASGKFKAAAYLKMMINDADPKASRS